MSMKKLLDSAQEAINKAQGAEIAQRSYQQTAAIERFEQNIKVWFPEEALAEFRMNETTFEWTRNQAGYFMIRSFSWRGALGQIYSGAQYKDRGGERSHLKITVANIDPRGHNWEKDLHLPTEAIASDVYYNLEARPLDPILFGSLLIETLNALQMQTEALQNRVQEEHDRKLSNACNSLRRQESFDELNKLLEDLLTRFPDPEDKAVLQNESKTAHQIIQQHLDLIRESHEQQEAINKERQRLERQALGMFRPFVVYKITFGFPGNGGDEESEAYTEEAWITHPDPDSNGWYMRVKYGNFSKARFFNVISIDEVICSKPEEVPSGVLKRDYLRNEEMDISIGFFIQPKPGLHYLFPAED